MTFGISAASATFQKMMSRMVGCLNWKIAIVYLDNIIVFAKDKEGNYRNLKLVFDRIKECGLKLKLEKCNILKEKVKKAIKKIQIPKCIKQPRRFLGL